MKSALAAKAALCVCPTLLAGAAVVNVPQARNAVHKATGAKSAVKRPARKPAGSVRQAALQLPCPPAFAGLIPSGIADFDPQRGMGSLASLGDLGTDNIGGGLGSGGGLLGIGGIFLGGSGSGGSVTDPGTTPGTPIVTPGGSAGAIPEPESWLLMVGGFAILGGALRWRRRGGFAGGSAKGFSLGSWTPSKVRISVAATVAAPEAIGVAAVASKSAMLGTLALCVCPPVIVAGTIAAVPAARQAVHTATAPPKVSAMLFRVTPTPTVPCAPGVETARALPIDTGNLIEGLGSDIALPLRDLDPAALLART